MLEYILESKDGRTPRFQQLPLLRISRSSASHGQLTARARICQLQKICIRSCVQRGCRQKIGNQPASSISRTQLSEISAISRVLIGKAETGLLVDTDVRTTLGYIGPHLIFPSTSVQ